MLNPLRTIIEALHRRLARRRKARPPDPRAWWVDPLSHPDLERMSQGALADLPFDPARLCTDEARAPAGARAAAQPAPAISRNRSARPAIACR